MLDIHIVIDTIYLKKEKVIQVSQEKLFGIKLEMDRKEVALHASLHLGPRRVNIRPVSS